MKALIQTVYWLLIILSCAGLSHLRQPITDMLSNFYLHFAFFGIVLFFTGLYWRLPRTALVSCSIAIITFALAVSYDRVDVSGDAIARNNGIAPKGTQTYRIMTFNAWERAKTMTRLKAYLRKEKPDFVVLQEITLKDWRSLKEMQDLYPYTSYCSALFCGVAMLSRHKWTTVKAQNFGPHSLPMITANFSDALKNLTLYAAHSARPHWKYSTQREQFEHLADYMKLASKTPSILAGDMNASIFSAVLRDFTANSSLKPAGTFAASWPQRLQQFGSLQLPILQLDIDHFFVKPDMSILRKWRGPDLGSDHRPMLMEFRL